MIGDPNWLYSTIAQSSAAIVAIVGGFITATVLMLTSEKRSLRHQQAEKKTRLGVLKAEEERLSDVYETMRVDRFFKAIADDLKKEEKLPSLEALIRNNPGWHLDPKILKREYEKLSKRRLEARDFIEQHSDRIDPTAFTFFDEWVKENELDISSYDDELLEEEYDRFRTREKEILEEERRKAVSPQLRGIFPIRTPLATMPLSPALAQQRTQYDLYRRERADRMLEDAVRRLSGLKQEISLLQGEVSNLDARLIAFGYPPYLGGGAAILVYLAAVGILLPVLIIGNQLYNSTLKQCTIALFSVGIMGIFTYIISLIRELRR